VENWTGDLRQQLLHRRDKNENEGDKKKQPMNQDAEPNENRAQTEQLM
jgi:hypothetical protein